MKFRNYLLAAAGVAILTCTLGITTSNGVIAAALKDVLVRNTAANPVPTVAQGTTTVSGNVGVSNSAASPVLIRNADEGVRVPFTGTLNGTLGSVALSGDAFFSPTPNRVLVVQTVSIGAEVPAGQRANYAIVQSTALGDITANLYIPLTFVGPSSNTPGYDLFVATQPVSAWLISQGASLNALVGRSGPSGPTGPGVYQFAVTGYYINP